MALNSASHNTPGDKTGPVTGQPPPVSSETTAALLGASGKDATGQSQGGQDQPDKDAPQKVKSEKQLEKERKQAEKNAKFAAKKAKEAAATSNQLPSRTKEKKSTVEAGAKAALPEYIEETPQGHKKILKPLDDEFHKAYNPKVVESAWYVWWEQQGFHEPEFNDGKVRPEGSFVISEPPPNVTGALHMGHALGNALQDLLIRWNRMKGLTTLWLPGCDHAGISTQSVVEKMLWRRERKTRYDLGREKFVQTTMDWKEEYHTRINAALKRMGGSLDWTREAFTMDSNLSAAVIETFVRLHEEGIIYRANRLVNWCTKLNTTLSNLEVDNKELEGRTLLDVPGYDRKVEFGVLTHFCYEIDGTDGAKIEVATTRPETMLGDTGIAVHPDDERYQKFIGRFAKHPFVDRLMPIFADEYVDPEFGTGAVKITPAHDPNDFDLGKRHDLEFINILHDDGTLNSNTGQFVGSRRFDARYEVIQALKDKGLYVKWENNPMKVPLCNKSKDVIEPLLKPQWWMKMQGLAEAGITAVEEGKIKIRPETAEKQYFTWMRSINDWCLSRQLWWGHQVPAYFVEITNEPGDMSDGDRWVAGRNREEAESKAKAKFPGKDISLRQDEDVLDTWFSSGLWPFSTLGWPKKTHDLEHLYPTSVLETGWDILMFWCCRMIMLGIKLTGQVPFHEIYCHTLIRDSDGRKMSKSLGNVIDPLDVMDGISLEALHEKLKVGNLDPKELATASKFQKTAFPDGIPECGADALRFSLVAYTTGGGDISFDVRVIHGYRKFANKIYQATKYVLGRLPPSFVPLEKPRKSGKESLAERWILHKLTTAAREINQALSDRQFAHSTNIVYAYWYNHLCDVYIESSKSILSSGNPDEQESALQTLYTALEGALTMIHPFMPFLTEEMWQRLPRRPNDTTLSICKAAYPVYNTSLDDPKSEEAYELLLDITKSIRSICAENSIKDSATIYIQLFDDPSLTTCKAELPSITTLSGKALTSGSGAGGGGQGGKIFILTSSDPKPKGCVVSPVNKSAAVFLEIKGRVDIDQEIAKARKKLAVANEGVKKQRGILQDEGFLKKVKEELKEVERRKLEDLEAEVRELEGSVERFWVMQKD